MCGEVPPSFPASLVREPSGDAPSWGYATDGSQGALSCAPLV